MIAEECVENMRKNQEMQITKAEEEDFKRCKKCHICNRDFGESDAKS
jgi:cytochrome c2